MTTVPRMAIGLNVVTLASWPTAEDAAEGPESGIGPAQIYGRIAPRLEDDSLDMKEEGKKVLPDACVTAPAIPDDDEAGCEPAKLEICDEAAGIECEQNIDLSSEGCSRSRVVWLDAWRENLIRLMNALVLNTSANVARSEAAGCDSPPGNFVGSCESRTLEGWIGDGATKE